MRPAWLLLLRISLAEAGKGRPRRVSKSHAARMPKRLHQPSRTPVSGKAAAARHQGVCVTRVGMACSRLTGLSGSVRDLLAGKVRSDRAGAKGPVRVRARARARCVHTLSCHALFSMKWHSLHSAPFGALFIPRPRLRLTPR